MSIKLHRHPLSGHSHRAQLALSVMGVAHELVDVDLMKGAHKAPEFVKLSPFGQVPVLDDNGTIVFDSNAILVYLATKYGPHSASRGFLPRGLANACPRSRAAPSVASRSGRHRPTLNGSGCLPQQRSIDRSCEVAGRRPRRQLTTGTTHDGMHKSLPIDPA
jgi:glutaredoxin